MKKLLFFLFSLILFVGSAAGTFYFLNLKKKVDFTVLSHSFAGTTAKKPLIPGEEKKLVEDQKVLLETSQYALTDSSSQALNPSSHWESRRIEIANIQIKNALNLPLYKIQYFLEVETSPQGGVLTVGVTQTQKGSQNPIPNVDIFSQWKPFLKVEALDHKRLKDKVYKDYKVDLYMIPQDGGQPTFLTKKIRIWTTGEAEVVVPPSS